jgi:hypothetical protein
MNVLLIYPKFPERRPVDYGAYLFSQALLPACEDFPCRVRNSSSPDTHGFPAVPRILPFQFAARYFG